MIQLRIPFLLATSALGFAVAITPAAAQQVSAAPTNAADLLGWSDKVGRVAPGNFADLIAVDTDPLADVSELERVRWVMKGGTVYVKP